MPLTILRFHEKGVLIEVESMQDNLPYEIKGWLVEHYNQLEVLRLKMWDAIQDADKSIERAGLDPTIVGVDAVASYDGSVLNIMVKDILPRSCLERAKNSRQPLRYRWLKGIVDAVNSVKKQGAQLHFKRAHCIISCYLPRKINWDVDNRAYKYIIDGLRYADVIDDDTADKLVFTVIGDVDKKDPRTEIIVIEFSMSAVMCKK